MGRPLALVRGVIGKVAILLAAIYGTIFIMMPLSPLVFIPGLHVVFRYYIDLIGATLKTHSIAVLRYFNGVNIAIHGDFILPADKAIVVMNHRSCLDWLYFWAVMLIDDTLFNMKIVLKRTFAHAPGAGWAAQLDTHLFLSRRAEVDLPWISAYLSYLASFKNRAFKLLIFPEGTTFCDSTKKKSDSYAEKNNLPHYNYLLHPRTTGADFVFKEMNQLESLTAVYDVTIAFDGPFDDGQLAMLKGDLPHTAHFFVKRYSVDSVTAVGPTKFWNDLWAEKEKFLEAYYRGDKLKELESCRNEGTFERCSEYAALFFWTFFTFYSTFFLIPAYWPYALFTTIAIIIWSEFTPHSIDGTIVQVGNKRL